MEPVWDGLTQPDLMGESRDTREQLADAARRFDWPRVTDILSNHNDLINSTRPGGQSLYAPLHQAAYGGAPAEVILELLRLGAWRTLQNARGERAVDIAERRGFVHLARILAPELKRRVPLGVLHKIQGHFHTVIRSRAEKEIQEHSLRLPEIEPLLEFDDLQVWFPVPGMYGGFSYRLVEDGVEAKLVSESWCRVAEGSGQRHEITSSGGRLVEEGFV